MRWLPEREALKLYGTKYSEEPRPGWFRLRRVRRGPWTPARIWESPAVDPDTGEPLDRGSSLLAEINGEPAELMEVWWFGRPILEAEYLDLIAFGPYNGVWPKE